MKGNNHNVLLDTGFWIALFSPEKEPGRCQKAEEVALLIEDANIFVPWPTLYEFVNSKLGRREALLQFEKVLFRPNVSRFSDAEYKESALENLFHSYGRSQGDISLVDEVIKAILTDNRLRIDYFISFDEALCNFAAAHGIDISLMS